MQNLSNQELTHVAGGIHLGRIVMTLAGGFIMGGPPGLGIAAASLIGEKGIDNLIDLYKN